MRARVIAAGMLLATGAGAFAQTADDEMEVQRCVWRCLADSPGAESAAYNACVAAKCSGGDVAAAPPAPAPAPAPPPARPPAPPPAALPQVWQGGTTADGQGRFAGLADPATGAKFYYMCDMHGASLLALIGPEAGLPAPLLLVVNGAPMRVTFQGSGITSSALVPPNHPMLATLARGGMLDIYNGAGSLLGRFSLTGAKEAIAAARTGCR